jgi:carboxypeptidase Q
MPNRVMRLAPALLASTLLSLAPPARAGGPAPDSPSQAAEVSARLVGAALTDGETLARLRELTDGVGPRLSGSPGAAAGVAWALRRFAKEGLDARAERVLVPRWERGPEAGAIVAGPGIAAAPLALATLGGSGPTAPEGLTAEVVEVRTMAEVRALGAHARGKIVLFQHGMATAADYGKLAELRVHGPAEAQRAGAVGALVRSLSTAADRHPHTGVTLPDAALPPFPSAAVAVPDAELLHRLLLQGPVRVRLRLLPRTLPDEESANVVAEVRGRELPQQIVLLAAHLDSWDLGQGAEDDGVGVAAVMEALRLVARERPRRTVRAVLFMNEENGGRGAEAYARAHAAELPLHAAALEADLGSGRLLSVQVHSGPSGAAQLQPWLGALAGLGVLPAADGEAGGSDLEPLTTGPQALPIVGLRQDATRYFDVHHGAADTFDHVRPQELAQLAAAVSVLTWALAEMAQPLPRAAPAAAGQASPN